MHPLRDRKSNDPGTPPPETSTPNVVVHCTTESADESILDPVTTSDVHPNPPLPERHIDDPGKGKPAPIVTPNGKSRYRCATCFLLTPGQRKIWSSPVHP